jgi:diaminohydroxyphosphoribosylaminopyrimidine deaminase/5-amino-6-(5-phosphoribosylamino)uracil reductase
MTTSLEIAPAIMRRALELARQGQGRVEPNPAVGAVVVDDAGRVLGEGWHQEFGGPHAEVHALAAAGNAARGATLFVTLEPCCHFGKTPPCSQAVIAAGIRRVIVAMHDPVPYVDGGGIRELQAAGIDVEVGLLESEAQRLVAPFVQLMTKARPWFHAKWAMTLDGKIATRTGHSQWISNDSSRVIVHRLRGRMDAILVGIGTVLADDPLLTSRPMGPRIATRVVIDSSARLPLTSQLVQTVSQAPLLVVTTLEAPQDRCDALRAAGVEVLTVDADSAGRVSIMHVAQELGRRRMTNVLIEGGSQILGVFFDLGLIDEVHAFVAPKLVGGIEAISPIAGRGLAAIPQERSLDESTIEILDGDLYLHGPIRRP